MSAFPDISRERLREKVESGGDFVLVDALPPMVYALSHLPGAVNITPGDVAERAPRRIPDLDTEVVVYCMSARCDDWRPVAEHLAELGYRNVSHFAAGKRGWAEAGLPLEGARA
jgi:rhodanese-related sulfurtransferase